MLTMTEFEHSVLVSLNRHWFTYLQKEYFHNQSIKKHITVYSSDEKEDEGVESKQYNTIFRVTNTSNCNTFVQKDYLSSDFQTIALIAEQEKRICFFYSRIAVAIERVLNERQFHQMCLAKQNFVTGQCIPKHSLHVWEKNVNDFHRIRLEEKRRYLGSGSNMSATSPSYRLSVEHETSSSNDEENSISSDCCIQALVACFGETNLCRMTFESNDSNELVDYIDSQFPTEVCRKYSMQLCSDSNKWTRRLLEEAEGDGREFYIFPKWDGVPATGIWFKDRLFLYSQIFGFRETRMPHVFNTAVRIQAEYFNESAIVTEFISIQNTTAFSYEDLQRIVHARQKDVTYVPVSPILNVHLKKTVSNFYNNNICTYVVDTIKLPNDRMELFTVKQLQRFRNMTPIPHTDGYIAVFCTQDTVGLKLKPISTVELELNIRDRTLQTIDGLDCTMYVEDDELEKLFQRFKWFNSPYHFPHNTVIVEMNVYSDSRLKYLRPRGDKCLPDSSVKLYTLFREAKR